MFRLKPVSLILCLFPLSLVACGDPTGAADPRTQPPLVRAATVERAVEGSRTFTGVVAARVQSNLGFRVSGKILERLVETGQSVRQGQALVRLDPADLSLQAQAGQQAVAAARARARQAINDEARYRQLAGGGAISASAYDQARAAADTAKADLSAAQAQYDVALNARGYAVLSADADGIVVDTQAEAGQVVAAGQTVITLAHVGQREAIVQLPETLRPAIGSTAQATLYGSGKELFPARLRVLSDAADPLTRTFEARYVLEGAPSHAPLGATISLSVAEGETSATRLRVPLAAIFDAGKGPGVWGISGKPAHVSWRPVQVLAVADDAAKVTGDLKPGEHIVALGAHLLHDGEQVRMKDPRQAPVAGSQP